MKLIEEMESQLPIPVYPTKDLGSYLSQKGKDITVDTGETLGRRESRRGSPGEWPADPLEFGLCAPPARSDPPGMM